MTLVTRIIKVLVFDDGTVDLQDTLTPGIGSDYESRMAPEEAASLLWNELVEDR